MTTYYETDKIVDQCEYRAAARKIREIGGAS